VKPQTPCTIGELLRVRSAEAPHKVCIAMDGEIVTYADMDRRSDALAASLALLGLGPGDRIAVLAPNRLELVELFYAIAKSGSVQVPLNPYLKGDFLLHQLRQSKSRILVTDAAGRAAVEPLVAALPDLQTVVMLDDAVAGETPYTTLFETDARPPTVQVRPADLMSILYTSGTTGLPKGCLASHGYYCRSARVTGNALEVDNDDILFAAMPLFHAGGQFITITLPLLFGIPAYLQSTFSARNFLPQAQKVGATLVIAVPAMVNAVLATEPTPADRDHTVRRIMSAPLSVQAQEAVRTRFGIDAWADVLGQTECMPTAVTALSSTDRVAQSCGMAAPDLEVALLDDEGFVIEGPGSGEVCVRPKAPYAMFDGYLDDPQATLDSFRGLWFHTGDCARRLPNGAFRYVDRMKDSLRRRGENISSFELEQAIVRHPAVVECAVHAVASPLGEDDVKVCIVTSSPVEPVELFAFFKNNLPYFAIPRFVDILDALPRNRMGKVMKHALRDAGNSSETWDFEALNLTVTRAKRR